ncbi:hypothetical protein QJQ45_002859 [Haematococcus lacustris]|nr:hypothetical protein QJQ45_002859 [Haematococcus lacustris]
MTEPNTTPPSGEPPTETTTPGGQAILPAGPAGAEASPLAGAPVSTGPTLPPVSGASPLANLPGLSTAQTAALVNQLLSKILAAPEALALFKPVEDAAQAAAKAQPATTTAPASYVDALLTPPPANTSAAHAEEAARLRLQLNAVTASMEAALTEAATLRSSIAELDRIHGQADAVVSARLQMHVSRAATLEAMPAAAAQDLRAGITPTQPDAQRPTGPGRLDLVPAQVSRAITAGTQATSACRLLPVGMVMVGMVLVVEGMVARVVVAAVMVVVMVVAVAMEVVAATHPGVPSPDGQICVGACCSVPLCGVSTPKPQALADNSVLHFSFSGSVNGIACTMLFDSGSAASFINCAAVEKCRLSSYRLTQPREFSVANGQPVLCTHAVTVELHVQSLTAKCELLVMPEMFSAFDVLMGSNWLTANGALLDYLTRTVTMQLSNNSAVLRCQPSEPIKASHCAHVMARHGTHTISANRAASWLRKGGHALVAMISAEQLNTPDSVPPVVSTKLKDLINEYSDVFAPFNGLPPERPIGHTIPLQPGCKPPALPAYRMTQPELAEMKKQITAFLAQGIIEPSSSPYAAPVLFVKKKSGELRMCVDYRQLNKQTLRDQYPLPRIDDLFDKLAGCTVFSSLDLQAGYHQIRIPAEDVPKTAFRTPDGHYQYKVLCFGLTNAPATFQRVMNDSFADVINDCALVYLDDILVMSKTVDEHFVHLRRVLDLLRKHKFFAKLSKCEFMKTALKFLGHIVSDRGVAVDPDKIQSITTWPVPNSLTALQRFLGAANFVRKFVHNFSALAAPLTDLTGKEGLKYDWKHWPDDKLQAFHALKHAVSKVPLLRIPDISKPFQVYCDASLQGVGAVLMQDGHPLAYLSKKLSPAEKNYSTGEQELLAIVTACKEWRCYLEGVPFTLYTDHRPLVALPNQKTLSRRQTRWMELLSRYTFTIEYLPGAVNPADPLSRIPDQPVDLLASPVMVVTRGQKRRLEGEEASGEHVVQQPAATPPVVQHIPAPPPLPVHPLHHVNMTEQLLAGYRNDPVFADISITDTYDVDEHGLYHTKDKKQIVVPDCPELRARILLEMHDAQFAGHVGITKTLERISRVFWWPRMRSEVRHYVANCDACQRNKSVNTKPEFSNWWQENVRQARHFMDLAQRRQAHMANKGRKEVKYVPGDLVLLSTKNLRLKPGKARKLLPRFVGPFKVLHIVNNVAVKLDLPPAMSRLHPVFHVSLLRKYTSDFPHLPPPVDWLDETPLYEVEKLLDHRAVRAGRARGYLVKWKGYDETYNTWEPRSNLVNCDEVLAAYNAVHGLNLLGRVQVAQQCLASKSIYQMAFVQASTPLAQAMALAVYRFVAASDLPQERSPNNSRLYSSKAICVMPRGEGGVGLPDLGVTSMAMVAKMLAQLWSPRVRPWQPLTHSLLADPSHGLSMWVITDPTAPPSRGISPRMQAHVAALAELKLFRAVPPASQSFFSVLAEPLWYNAQVRMNSAASEAAAQQGWTHVRHVREALHSPQLEGEARWAADLVRACLPEPWQGMVDRLQPPQPEWECLRVGPGVGFVMRRTPMLQLCHWVGPNSRLYPLDPTGQGSLGAFWAEEGAAWAPAAVARHNKPSYRLTPGERATHLRPLPAQRHVAQEQAQGQEQGGARAVGRGGGRARGRGGGKGRGRGGGGGRGGAGGGAGGHVADPADEGPGTWPKEEWLLGPSAHVQLDPQVWGMGTTTLLDFSVKHARVRLHQLQRVSADPLSPPSGSLWPALWGVRPPRAAGEPEVAAVADGALRELELKWEASAQQVADQGAAGEREQQGRDVEVRLTEEVQGSQPPRWLDTSARAHQRPSPQMRVAQQAERQLEAHQRRGGRRPLAQPALRADTVDQLAVGVQAGQPCAKVWKELLDPTLRREHVIVAWRVLHASLMVGALWGHILKGTAAPGSSACRFCQPGHLDTLTHAFLACPAVVPAWEWVLDVYGRLTGTRPPSGDAMLLLSGRPTRGEAPPFQPPDSLLWLRLRVAYLSTLTTAVKRAWHRVGRDIRVGLCGAVPSTWFKGKDPELDAAHFDQLWPEASGGWFAKQPRRERRGGQEGAEGRDTMEAMGFCREGHVRWSQLLHRGATSQVLLNGHLTDSFPLGSALLRGSGASPLCWCIVFQPLVSYLSSLQLAGRISTPTIPSSPLAMHRAALTPALPSKEYADDLTIVVLDRVRDGKVVGEALGLFRAAGGPALNLSKSSALPCAQPEPGLGGGQGQQQGGREQGGEKEPEVVIPAVRAGVPVRHLGVPLGAASYAATSEAAFGGAAAAMMAASLPWRPQGLNLLGRVQVAQQCLASKSIYQMAFVQASTPLAQAMALAVYRFVAASDLPQERSPNSSRLYPNKAICVMPRGEGGVGLPDLGVTSTAMLAKMLAQLWSPRVRPWQPLTHSLLADPSHGLSTWVITDPTAPPSRGISPRLQAHVTALAELKLFRAVPPASQSFFSVLAEPLWYNAQVRMNPAAREAAAEQGWTHVRHVREALHSPQLEGEARWAADLVRACLPEPWQGMVDRLQPPQPEWECLRVGPGVGFVMRRTPLLQPSHWVGPNGRLYPLDPTGQGPLGAFWAEGGAAWEPAAVARLNKPSYRLTPEERATHLRPLPAQHHVAQEQAQGQEQGGARAVGRGGGRARGRGGGRGRGRGGGGGRRGAGGGAGGQAADPADEGPGTWPKEEWLLGPWAHLQLDPQVWGMGTTTLLDFSVKHARVRLHQLQRVSADPLSPPSGSLWPALWGVRPPRAAGEPEVAAVADGALRELELKWEASAQQVADQGAAGEREQQGRDVEVRLTEEVQGSQPPRWLDTSARAHQRPSPQMRVAQQAERQLEAHQRRGGRRPLAQPALRADTVDQLAVGVQAGQPCAKVWKELLDPTLRREHVIVAWRVLHASLMVGALWGHILKGTAAPGSSACRFCQPGHLDTLTHAFLACPAVVPAWEWVLDVYGRLTGTRPPSGDAMLLLSGRPTRGEAPPFQPPDSLLWLRLRVAYLSTLTTAVKRAWHRVGRDIRVGLCGAVPSTWFKGKDPELDAAHFDQLWPEASGGWFAKQPRRERRGGQEGAEGRWPVPYPVEPA